VNRYYEFRLSPLTNSAPFKNKKQDNQHNITNDISYNCDAVKFLTVPADGESIIYSQQTKHYPKEPINMGAGCKHGNAYGNNNEIGDDEQYRFGRIVVPAPAFI